jgi:hypothetical protein
MKHVGPAFLLAATFLLAASPEAFARPRRPSAAQMKQMKEQAGHLQREMVRHQMEIAAKEREVYLSFDQNGNGRLEGGVKARYDSSTHAVKQGKKPNPLESIAPRGKGPKDWTPGGATGGVAKTSTDGGSGFN